MVSPSVRPKSFQEVNWTLPVLSAMSPPHTVLSSSFTLMVLVCTSEMRPVTLTFLVCSVMSPMAMSCAEEDCEDAGASKVTSSLGSTLPRRPMLSCTWSLKVLV